MYFWSVVKYLCNSCAWKPQSIETERICENLKQNQWFSYTNKPPPLLLKWTTNIERSYTHTFKEGKCAPLVAKLSRCLPLSLFGWYISPGFYFDAKSKWSKCDVSNLEIKKFVSYCSKASLSAYFWPYFILLYWCY